MSGIPTVNDHDQVIMPVPTQAELDAVAQTPTSQYVEQNAIGEVAGVGVKIAKARALADNKIIRLSVGQKLRMIHQGLKEIAQSWASAPEYVSLPGGTGGKLNLTATAGVITGVTVNAAGTGNTDGTWDIVIPGGIGGIIRYTSSGGAIGSPTIVKGGTGYTTKTLTLSNTYQYVATEVRPLNQMAEDQSGYVITNPGTFTETTGYKHLDYNGNPVEPFDSWLYDDNWSSSSVNNDLVEGIASLEAELDQDHGIIIDAPGRTGGSAMTEDNYLSMPGYEVTTSLTTIAAIAKIEAMRVLGNASALVAADLLNAGVAANSIQWSIHGSDYKSAIAAATSAITIESLGQIIVTANA